MLIKFSVQNFLSFKDSQSLSMSGNKSNRLPSHLKASGNNRILRSALLFGANASGKSNFIKAIDFAKSLVINGDTSRVNTNQKYFRIDEEYKNNPGIFQFDLEINNRYYCYGFAISYMENKIVSEWLIDTTGKENTIFSKEQNNNKTSVTSTLKIDGKDNLTRFKIYLQDFEKEEMSNLLILTDLAKRTSDIEECNILREIMDWYNKIIIIYPFTHNRNWGFNMFSDNNSDLIKTLSELDTGIEEGSILEKDLDSILRNMNSEMKANLKKDIVNNLKEHPKESIYLPIYNNFCRIKNKKNSKGIEPVAQTIAFNHGNDKDCFEFKDESDGTQRILDLLPLLNHNNSDNLILIDELSQNLHTKLAQNFYTLFMNSNKNTKTQLIFTTHDILLMDLDLERQDEIWFVERERNHSSKLYSLSDFKVRCDKNVGKEYLLGRYGALPVLNNVIDFGGKNDCKQTIK